MRITNPDYPNWAQVPLAEVSNPDIEMFVDYWRGLKGGAFAPSWRDFDLSAVAPGLIPFLVVMDVLRDPLNFKVRFWGTGHVTRKGVDKTGWTVKDTPEFRGAVFDEYTWVVENKAPLASVDLVDLQHTLGIMPFDQTIVRLPLSDDGIEVHHIVSLALWARK